MLAKVLVEIHCHDCPQKKSHNWEKYTQFLEGNKNKLMKNEILKEKKIFSSFDSYLENYLSYFDEEIKKEPCLIHSDITDDHLIIKMVFFFFNLSNFVDFF